MLWEGGHCTVSLGNTWSNILCRREILGGEQVLKIPEKMDIWNQARTTGDQEKKQGVDQSPG